MTRKRKKILLISIAIAVFVCLAVLVICFLFPSTLSTPTNLRVVNNILYWDEVKGAKGYTLNIDGEMTDSFENNYPVSFLGQYKVFTIQVSAEGKNGRCSDWSEPYSYEVVKPEGYYENLILYKNNGGYTVSFNSNSEAKKNLEGTVIIPQKYNGEDVIEIAEGAFTECEGITALLVPNTVKKIGAEAFQKCTGLQTVYLQSVEDMGGAVFRDCSSLERAFIGNCADIPVSCFSGCEKLRGLESYVPLQSIGKNAFIGCVSMTSFHATAQLRSIEGDAFSHCKNLRSLTVDEENPVYRSEGNCIIRKADNVVVVGCTGSVIPKGVTAIGKKAFSGSGLEQAVIPEGVSSIAFGAFSNCQVLIDVQLPNSLEEIGNSAFGGCEKLTHITLDEGLKSIGQEAFAATSLTKLEIPTSVTEIGVGAVISVSEMLAVKDGNANYYSKDNCIFSRADGKLVAGCSASSIPTGTKVIGEGAFAGYPLSEIVLPEGLEVIELGAFELSKLQHVDFPSSLRVIESSAFYDCYDLRYFSIPDTVTSIDSGAFALSELSVSTSVTISGKVGYVGLCVFIHPTLYVDYVGEGWATDGEGLTSSFRYMGKIVYSELHYDGRTPYVYSIECPKVDSGPLLIPYRKGYEFMGWATEEGSDAVAYPTVLEEKRFVTFPLGAPHPEEGTRLYAIWKELDA